MFAVQEGAIFLQAGATANYEFKVPVGQSLTVAYGIPTGGRLNSAPAEISVNGVTLETIDKDRDYVWGAITPRQRLLWHKSFGPGNYVVTIRSGGVAVNFYGLWVGAPQSIAPAPPTFPAPTLKPVYQVNCGGERVESFSADKFFSGGRTYTTTDGITTTRVPNPPQDEVTSQKDLEILFTTSLTSCREAGMLCGCILQRRTRAGTTARWEPGSSTCRSTLKKC